MNTTTHGNLGKMHYGDKDYLVELEPGDTIDDFLLKLLALDSGCVIKALSLAGHRVSLLYTKGTPIALSSTTNTLQGVGHPG